MLCFNSTTRILIVVSTFNRKDLTGQCLNSIARSKFPWTSVVILDDASVEYGNDFLSLWGFPVHRRIKSVGVGIGAKARLEYFLSVRKEFQFLMACDNDLTFADLFDLRMRSLWERAWMDVRCPTILSGYHSVSYDPIGDHVGYHEVPHVGGACQFMDRETAAVVMKMMNESDWGGEWDTVLSRSNIRKVVPKKSLVEHHGIFGNGHNGRSWDIAVTQSNYEI